MRLRCDFDTAVRRGRRVGRRTLVVHAAMSASDRSAPPRIGFIVSRAVGSAVIRNRVKRRLRAAMHARRGELPSGVLVVLRANPAAGSAAWKDLLADLDAALPRAVTRASQEGVAG